MKLVKIGFVLAVLLLSMSMASAIEYSKYAAPSMFNESGGFYGYETGEFQFSICQFGDAEGEFDFYFNSDENYTIVKNDTIGNYTDKSLEEVGTIEMVELDGQKYIVQCCYKGGIDESKIKDCCDSVVDFNKQNNLKPLPING